MGIWEYKIYKYKYIYIYIYLYIHPYKIYGCCNILDRCGQQTTGPPKKSTQHQGPGTGDLEGDAKRERRGGERHTEQQGRLDTLIFRVKIK